MESNSVCNHTSDNKFGRPRSGSPICLSRVWWQTELDDTKSYYHLIIKLQFPRKEELPSYERKGKFAFKYWQRRSKLCHVALKLRLVDWNFNFECDWLIELPDNKLSDNNLASELVENGIFQPITIEEIVIRLWLIIFMEKAPVTSCGFQRGPP